MTQREKLLLKLIQSIAEEGYYDYQNNPNDCDVSTYFEVLIAFLQKVGAIEKKHLKNLNLERRENNGKTKSRKS